MHTVFHTTIDGYEVMTGFGEATIDPVATFAVVTPILGATEEAKQLQAMNAQIQDAHAHIADAEQKKADAYVRGDNFTFQLMAGQSAAYYAKVEDLQAQAVPLIQAQEAKKLVLMGEHAQYLSPTVGEMILDDAGYAKLSAAAAKASKTQKVCMDGTTVDDYRGVTFWTNDGRWTKSMISDLGETVPSTGLLDSALTADQRTAIAAQDEADRVAALSPDARLAEAKAAQTQAQANAAQAANVAAITGVAVDAKGQYADALSAISAKYSVNLK